MDHEACRQGRRPASRDDLLVEQPRRDEGLSLDGSRKAIAIMAKRQLQLEAPKD